MITISWTQLLAGAFALAVTVVGATFAITRLATESHVNALLVQNSHLDRRVKDLESLVQSGPASVRTVAALEVAQAPEARKAGLSITFKQPSPEAQVPQFIDIEYVIADTIPAGHQAVLVVRDPIGQYWPWGSSASGRHRRIQIGVAEDTGRQFEIGVLVTKQELPFGRPRNSLPDGLSYASINVTRR